MAEFENGILGMIPQAEWLDVGFNVTRQTDPIDGIMDDIRTNNLVAYYQTIAAEYQIPMMAQFHGFDTESQTTFRVPVDTHNIEKGLIKVKQNQSERLRALIRSGVRQDELYDYVIRDGVRLADQVVTRSKVAKNELLATGKVTIKENDLDLTVDYGVDTVNQIDITFNTGEQDDVLGQIQDVIDKATAKGVTLNGMLTSRAMLAKLRKNESIQAAINGALMQGQLVGRNAFDEFMNSEFGINTIITNDLTYGASAELKEGRPSVAITRYYPVDRITLFATNPNGQVGVGLWGDPPEADVDDFASKGTSDVSPYVYVTQWNEKDPAVLWTKASGLFIPVLYNPSALWVLKDAGE